MNIIYHHRTRAEDAQGIHITEIIHAFEKLGHTVEVVGLVAHSREDQKPGKAGIISRLAANVPPIIYELMEMVYNFYGVYQLLKAVKRTAPDFIYERYALFNVAGLIASKISKVPLIEEVNAPLAREKAEHDTLVLKRWASFCEKLICTYAYKTIVVSTPLKKKIQEHGIPENKFAVIPNGVNDSHFHPGVDGSRVKKEYHLDGKIVIGFVGWFRKWHGLEELLKVYFEQDFIKKNIHILLVGDGPAFSDLVKMAENYNILNTGVSFTGPVKRQEIPEYLAAFDLALQPDVTDYASPIKLFEYISMGKGVVAPDKANIIEILGPDYPGLFSASDWGDMGHTIIRLCASDESIKMLCKQSYEVFLSGRFLWRENALRTLNLLQERIDT